MERQLALLVRLIDDLLDVARITRGKLVLRRQATTLEEVLQAAIEVARPPILQGGHQLHVQQPPQPVSLFVERVRLAPVFATLLTHPAKYSDARRRIHLVPTAQDAGVEGPVPDTGPCPTPHDP